MTDGASALIPPNDIKQIIETTASFVVRNGETFEKKVSERERNNPKFAFLKPTDAYHTYYRTRISYFQHNKAAPAASSTPSAPASVAKESDSASSKNQSKKEPVTESKLVARGAEVINAPAAKPVLKAPPKDRFSFNPPHIPLQDLDIIKLTAQFVARNGPSFQMSLMAKEHRNATFDFMKQNNQYYPYFQALVEQYRSILRHDRNIVETLRRDNATRYDVLTRLVDRVEWELQQDKERKEAELEREAEKVAFASIDWQHFVVVQTIDIDDDDDDDEDGDGSIDPGVLARRTANAEAAEEMQRRTIAAALQTEPPPPSPPQPQDSGLKRERPADTEETEAEQPAAKKTKRSKKKSKTHEILTQICPNCGQAIPIEEMTEHLRIETLDPRAREQKALHVERLRGANASLAPDMDIAANLAAFANRRTDIVGNKEAEISAIEAAKAREREERERAHAREDQAWDGFSVTQPPVARSAGFESSLADKQLPQLPPAPPMQQPAPPPPPPLPPGQPGIPIPAPPPPGTGLSLPPMPPPPAAPGLPPAAPAAEEAPAQPSNGRIDESEFMRMHGGPDAVIHVRVQLPAANSFTASSATAAWTHLGEELTCTLRLGESVAALKAAVFAISKIPANKQKLTAGQDGDDAAGGSGSGNLLRDKDTLAACNIADNSLVILRIKERGGKKR